MNRNGECIENYHDVTLDVYRIRFNEFHLVAVPKDYINFWKSGHKCEKEGCFKDGSVKCRVPESSPEKIENLCFNHAFKSGYCIVCGEFCGDDKDFIAGNGLCDNCEWAGDYDNAD